MKILVTGGAGFIGSNLTKRLATENDVHVLDDLSNGFRENIKNVKWGLYVEDILKFDFSQLKNIDFIYHLACQKMIHSFNQPFQDLDVNAKGTLRILEFARKNDIPVLFTSSGSVYGNPEVFPTPEESPRKPLSPYGVSKLASEEYCKLYHRLYGLKTFITRLHCVYGINERAIGVISTFIQQGLKGMPFTVEGDGNQKRSFTYVEDCIDGILTISRYGKAGEIYNVSGSEPTSVNEVAKLIADLLEIPFQTTFMPRRKGDIDFVLPNTAKLQKLGWKAKTPLKEGIRKTIEWWKHNA